VGEKHSLEQTREKGKSGFREGKATNWIGDTQMQKKMTDEQRK